MYRGTLGTWHALILSPVACAYVLYYLEKLHMVYVVKVLGARVTPGTVGDTKRIVDLEFKYKEMK